MIFLCLSSLCQSTLAQDRETSKPFTDDMARIGGFVGGAAMWRPVMESQHTPIRAVHDILGNPYRQFDGTLFNLGYLIKWNDDEARRYNAAKMASQPFRRTKRPMPSWGEYAGRIDATNRFGLVFQSGRNTYSVTNFPGASAQLIGRDVSFFAQTIGTFRDGQQHGIRLDYGVPVRPVPAPAKSTNSIAKQ